MIVCDGYVWLGRLMGVNGWYLVVGFFSIMMLVFGLFVGEVWCGGYWCDELGLCVVVRMVKKWYNGKVVW